MISLSFLVALNIYIYIYITLLLFSIQILWKFYTVNYSIKNNTIIIILLSKNIRRNGYKRIHKSPPTHINHRHIYIFFQIFRKNQLIIIELSPCVNSCGKWNNNPMCFQGNNKSLCKRIPFPTMTSLDDANTHSTPWIMLLHTPPS